MADTDFIAVSDPYIGDIFGDEFTVENLIGMGGMGAVYRAIQSVTDRAVALKVLHRHLSSDLLVKRFRLEAQIISKLNHPHVVTVFKYGQHSDGALYIAMELAEGRTLTDLIQSRALMDPRRYVPLMMQIVDAVGYAHDLKIIHRDLKPENVMVVRSGRKERVKVLDFGIAKIVDTKYVITKTGMLCGSPPYMAPEQWSQVRDLDGRVDIYALGVLFYAMVTGRLPYEADNTPGYMSLHLAGDPVPPIRRSETLHQVPELNDIILRCLRTARSERYADAYVLLEALKAVYLELQTGNTTSGEGAAVAADTRAHALDQPALPTASQVESASGEAPKIVASETLAYGDGTPGGERGDAGPCKPTRSHGAPVALFATLVDEPAVGSEPPAQIHEVGSLEWTRQVQITEAERARGRKVHRLFLSAGVSMLVFLALAFVYFVWIDLPATQSTSETQKSTPIQDPMTTGENDDTEARYPDPGGMGRD